jgi:hypothetical protein
MPEEDAQQLDRLLLKAICGFVLRHNKPVVAGFKPAIRDWGDTWQDVGEAYLPAAELLTSSLATTSTHTQDLLSLFEQY